MIEAKTKTIHEILMLNQKTLMLNQIMIMEAQINSCTSQTLINELYARIEATQEWLRTQEWN